MLTKIVVCLPNAYEWLPDAYQLISEVKLHPILLLLSTIYIWENCVGAPPPPIFAEIPPPHMWCKFFHFETYVPKLAEGPEVGGGQEIEEFLANEEIEEMRDFLCFSSQEKKFLKNSTQTKKSKTFTLTKITYKKCVHFHAREEVCEEIHANQEVEEIFSRKNKQHLVGVATFPKTLW